MSEYKYRILLNTTKLSAGCFNFSIFPFTKQPKQQFANIPVSDVPVRASHATHLFRLVALVDEPREHVTVIDGKVVSLTVDVGRDHRCEVAPVFILSCAHTVAYMYGKPPPSSSSSHAAQVQRSHAHQRARLPQYAWISHHSQIRVHRDSGDSNTR